MSLSCATFSAANLNADSAQALILITVRNNTINQFFHIKSVTQCHFPFSRVNSVNCKLCFLLASNIAVAEKTESEYKCSVCKHLI